MSDNIEKYILKIPIIRLLIIIPQKIYLPKFKGLTLYDLLLEQDQLHLVFLWHCFLLYYFF